MIKTDDFIKTLNLEVLNASSKDEMDINATDLNRPGMQFCGFYEEFYVYAKECGLSEA